MKKVLCLLLAITSVLGAMDLNVVAHDDVQNIQISGSGGTFNGPGHHNIPPGYYNVTWFSESQKRIESQNKIDYGRPLGHAQLSMMVDNKKTGRLDIYKGSMGGPR
jgi:hypothetical protein